MAQKLVNLRVKKVDFVDEGANPRADIKLFKRKEPEEPPAPASGGEDALADSIMKRIAEKLSGLLGKERIKKGEAVSFAERMNEASREKIMDEMWTVCYALQSSLGSILADKELEEAEKLEEMQESIEEFSAAIRQYVPAWAVGEPARFQEKPAEPEKSELPVLLTVYRSVGAQIEKLKDQAQEGEREDMLNIDKSKMTPKERTAYEELVKKYAVESEEESLEKKKAEDPEEELEEEEETKKKCGDTEETKKSVSAGKREEEDIYKGLHPAVKAEMEALKKFREDTLVRELERVAKKYEIIGKNPEELVPTLKSLKEAGGTAYDDMISLLDSMVDTVEQTGVFGEIGKSGSGSPASGREEAVAKARVKAAEIRKSRPELTEAQAMDAALLENPELLKQLDE